MCSDDIGGSFAYYYIMVMVLEKEMQNSYSEGHFGTSTMTPCCYVQQERLPQVITNFCQGASV
jgi:hypothetical protein